MKLKVLDYDDAPSGSYHFGANVWPTLPVDNRSDREIGAELQAELEMEGFQFADRKGIDPGFWNWRFA